MAKPIASFPGTVWDGTSENPNRPSRLVEAAPNNQDWDRIVSEVIAIQAAGGGAGSAGANGATWRTGAGAPSNGTGVDGDLYLNTTNYDVYKRVAGAYSLVGNIKGADAVLTGQVRIDAHYGVITADADAATVTFDLALTDKHIVTLGGNRTLALSGGQVGQSFMVILKQDGTGSRTVTWWPGILWPGGVAPTLTTAAGKADIFMFVKASSSPSYYGFVSGQNL